MSASTTKKRKRVAGSGSTDGPVAKKEYDRLMNKRRKLERELQAIDDQIKASDWHWMQLGE